MSTETLTMTDVVPAPEASELAVAERSHSERAAAEGRGNPPDSLPFSAADAASKPAHAPLDASTSEHTTLGLVDDLLRNHGRLLARIAAGEDLGGLARSLVLIIAVSAALFGAAMGAYRGGIQVLFAGIKLPAALLFTAALVTPAFAAMNAAARGRLDPRRDGAVMLTALAAASLLISGTAPLILLAGFWGVSYHDTVLLVVGSCGVGGLFGLGFFLRSVLRGAGLARLWVALGVGVVFAGVGSQMSWTLRPFLVRPRTVQAPFLRDLEGSFLDSVGTSVDSARGRFRREEAPLPELGPSNAPPMDYEHER